MNNSIEGYIINNKYKVIERIGLGGTAVVFKGKNIVTGEIVAIKILKEEFIQDAEFIKRFRKEAEAAAKLMHPNVVSVKDIGQDDDIIYIVMEYVEGVTLKDYIDAMQYISWQDTLKVAKQILAAVDHAHKNHIIHRDIKPMNIMVADSGAIKLTDFGIAKAVSNSTIQANDNSAGSVHYLSPEQARGGFVDERSDIYSIGITLYELVTGVVPFDGDSHISIALKHLDGKIVPPKEVDPEIPQGVNDLIVMATRKDPGARFQSARDMLARLNMVIENPNVSFLDSSLNEIYEPVETLQINSPEEKEIEKSEPQPEVQYVDTAEIVRNVTMKTITYIMAILVGVVAIIFVAGLTSRVNGNLNGLVTEKYIIQNYVGLRADEVVPVLKEYGINVSQTIITDELLPTGYIVSQNIEEGTAIKKGDKLQIEISGGEGDFVLEDYTDKDYRLVDQDLTNLKVTVKIKDVSSNTIQAGNIVRTSPVSGSLVTPGDTVTIYRSIGVMYNTVTVPNLIGLSLEEVTQKLEDLKLSIGKAYPEPGSDITDILPTPSKTPTPSETPESTLTPTQTPTPTPSETEPEPSTMETLEPTTEPTPSVTKDPNKTYAYDTVVYQFPAPGTVLHEYETVDIYFYEVESLRDYVEYLLPYPYGTATGRVHLRIEAIPADGLLQILLEGNFEESEFPIKYKVPKSFRGETKVVIRLNRNLYLEQYV